MPGTNVNLQLEMTRTMRDIPEGTPLFLHACCGPCTSGVLPRLCGHFAVTVFFYNPNIAPRQEYLKRRDTLLQLLDRIPTSVYPVSFMEDEYDEAAFTAASAGLEGQPEGGARCDACFGLRLGRTARVAAEKGFAWACTTLSVSPHKNAALLHQAGQRAATQYGIQWLPADFKKKDGYRLSIQNSEKYGLYRQSWCGCSFSMAE